MGRSNWQAKASALLWPTPLWAVDPAGEARRRDLLVRTLPWLQLDHYDELAEQAASLADGIQRGGGDGTAVTLPAELLHPLSHGGIETVTRKLGELEQEWQARLSDLVWELEICDPGARAAAAARLAAASTRSWGSGDGEPELVGLLAPARMLRKEFDLPGMFFEDPDTVDQWHREWVALDDDWRARFEANRQKVLAEIVRRKVVVESCPTSNRVVANLSRAPIEVFANEPRLRCVVATDDPGIFGAWPADEVKAIPEDRKKDVLAEAHRSAFCRRRGDRLS